MTSRSFTGYTPIRGLMRCPSGDIAQKEAFLSMQFRARQAQYRNIRNRGFTLMRRIVMDNPVRAVASVQICGCFCLDVARPDIDGFFRREYAVHRPYFI